MTMIRSVIDEGSAMSMIPNELLFEIFSHLEAPELEIPLDEYHVQLQRRYREQLQQQQRQPDTATSTATSPPPCCPPKMRAKKCAMM